MPGVNVRFSRTADFILPKYEPQPYVLAHCPFNLLPPTSRQFLTDNDVPLPVIQNAAPTCADMLATKLRACRQALQDQLFDDLAGNDMALLKLRYRAVLESCSRITPTSPAIRHVLTADERLRYVTEVLLPMRQNIMGDFMCGFDALIWAQLESSQYRRQGWPVTEQQNFRDRMLAGVLRLVELNVAKLDTHVRASHRLLQSTPFETATDEISQRMAPQERHASHEVDTDTAESLNSEQDQIAPTGPVAVADLKERKTNDVVPLENHEPNKAGRSLAEDPDREQDGILASNSTQILIPESNGTEDNLLFSRVGGTRRSCSSDENDTDISPLLSGNTLVDVELEPLEISNGWLIFDETVIHSSPRRAESPLVAELQVNTPSSPGESPGLQTTMSWDFDATGQHQIRDDVVLNRDIRRISSHGYFQLAERDMNGSHATLRCSTITHGTSRWRETRGRPAAAMEVKIDELGENTEPGCGEEIQTEAVEPSDEAPINVAQVDEAFTLNVGSVLEANKVAAPAATHPISSADPSQEHKPRTRKALKSRKRALRWAAKRNAEMLASPKNAENAST
jgi:hypothetical protein